MGSGGSGAGATGGGAGGNFSGGYAGPGGTGYGGDLGGAGYAGEMSGGAGGAGMAGYGGGGISGVRGSGWGGPGGSAGRQVGVIGRGLAPGTAMMAPGYYHDPATGTITSGYTGKTLAAGTVGYRNPSGGVTMISPAYKAAHPNLALYNSPLPNQTTALTIKPGAVNQPAYMGQRFDRRSLGPNFERSTNPFGPEMSGGTLGPGPGSGPDPSIGNPGYGQRNQSRPGQAPGGLDAGRGGPLGYGGTRRM